LGFFFLPRNPYKITTDALPQACQLSEEDAPGVNDLSCNSINLQSEKSLIMKLLISALFIIATSLTEAQQILDFKVKSEANAKERTFMLDLMREEISRIDQVEIKFVVEREAQQKDGKSLDFGPDFPGDCCSVLSLFQKNNGVWTIAEFLPFCTDVCHWGIANRFPSAPKGIFPPGEVYFAE
jgi:hypothetical protein